MLDTSSLPAHVLAFTQQLVGGNTNLEEKLQAVVPGVFGATGGIGQSPRRLVNLRLAYFAHIDQLRLVATTLSRDGYQWFTYGTDETNCYTVWEGPVDFSKIINEEEWALQASLQLAYAEWLSDAAVVAFDDESWFGTDEWDFSVWPRATAGQVFTGDSQWWVSGYRVVGGVTQTDSCVWSHPLPERVARELRSHLAKSLGIEGGESTS